VFALALPVSDEGVHLAAPALALPALLTIARLAARTYGHFLCSHDGGSKRYLALL
jgi:hypothetical protein